jgi:hypothetical protein
LNDASERQSRPWRSWPLADTSTRAPAGRPRTATGNGSSNRLSAGASMATPPSEASAGGGAWATISGSSAVRRSTCADRDSNHGGKAAEIAPAMPIATNGITQ